MSSGSWQAKWQPVFRLLATSALISALVWLIVTWPLVRYIFEGIPASHKGPPTERVRYMIPGDHLQLLYHFWLVSDMLKGRTPWGYNLYEFNDGDDSAREERGGWYLPFSLVYAVAAEFAGRAFGWNFAGFLSIWITAIFVLLLARRYTDIAAVQELAAFVGIAFLYRWVTLMGGSPTGFSMAWPPAILLGVDEWVRDGRARGSIIAGLAVIAAGAGDPQLFFFCGLALPMFALLACLGVRDFSVLRSWEWWRSRLVSAVWLVAGVVVALPITAGTAGAVDPAARAGERAWQEVALFAPRPAGLFFHNTEGPSAQIYFGIVMAVLSAWSLALMVHKGRCDRVRRMWWWLQGATLAVGLVGVVLLALGPYGPWDGFALRAVRKLIPPYRLIRQTAKVYCILPTLLSYLVVVGLGSLSATSRMRRDITMRVFALLVSAAYLVELKRALHPHICLLHSKQGAYAAISDRAAQDNTVARALVIPLWPGDSHYASVYQYYVALYRVRMVNGYRPFVPANYISNVFLRFESVNQGHLTDEQLEELLHRGIRYVLLHEDLYPEKVAPFPVGRALHSLLCNRRLRLLERDRSVWAFEVLAQNSATQHVNCGGFEGYFPAWRWYPRAWRSVGAKNAILDYEKIRLSEGDHIVELRRPISLAPYPRLRFGIFCGGSGIVEITLNSQTSVTCEVSDEGRSWREVPLPVTEEFRHYVPRIARKVGTVDIYEVALLAGTPVKGLAETGEVMWPAAWFFRAGWSDPQSGVVVFEPLETPADEIFYGPRLPLPPGEYETELVFESDAPNGQDIGAWRVEDVTEAVPVVAGRKAVLSFAQDGQHLFSIRFRYFGGATVKLHRVILRRIGGGTHADAQS